MKFQNLTFLFILGTTLIFSSCKQKEEILLPEARFTSPIIEYGKVTFRNYSLNATDFLWDFGDGNTSTEREPIHEYKTLGTYTVKLIASNGANSDSYFLVVAIGQIFPDNLSELDQLPFGALVDAFYFTHDGKAYVGGGQSYTDFELKNELWEFEPQSKTWTNIHSTIPFTYRSGATFKIGNKVYLGLGNTIYDNHFPIYEYDIIENSFSYDSDYNLMLSQNNTIASPIAFSYENNGYVIGNVQLNFLAKKMSKYNPDSSTWLDHGEFPCSANSGMYHFQLGNKLIVGMGGEQGFVSSDNSKEVWEYDLETEEWTRKNDFPGGARRDGISFIYDGEGYFGFGVGYDINNNIFNNFSDLWKYDQENDQWDLMEDFPVSSRQNLFAFVLGNSLYFGGGRNQNLGSSKFFEYQF